jgi:hypothetical protein
MADVQASEVDAKLLPTTCGYEILYVDREPFHVGRPH